MMANIPKECKLTFISQTTFCGKSKGLYRCDCGTVKEYTISNVKRGNTKSCGCLKRERDKYGNITHGMATPGRVHPLYLVWRTIKSRCYNPKVGAYSKYGGRGVEVCELWKNSFVSFYDWCMGNGWERGLHIDKDIKAKEMGVQPLLYSPERCSIVTCKTNMNNTSKNIIVQYKNENMTLAKLSEIFNINYGMLRYRIIEKGWSIDKCILELSKIV